MNSTIVPLFSFADQCHWLRAWLDRPPSLDLVDSHELDVYHAVENLMETGEVRMAAIVAWLSIIRSSDPTAEILIDIQAAIRAVVLAKRPSLLTTFLEIPSRAGEGAPPRNTPGNAPGSPSDAFPADRPTSAPSSSPDAPDATRDAIARLADALATPPSRRAKGENP